MSAIFKRKLVCFKSEKFKIDFDIQSNLGIFLCPNPASFIVWFIVMVMRSRTPGTWVKATYLSP